MDTGRDGGEPSSFPSVESYPGDCDISSQFAGKDEEGEAKETDPEQPTDQTKGITDDRQP